MMSDSTTDLTGRKYAFSVGQRVTYGSSESEVEIIGCYNFYNDRQGELGRRQVYLVRDRWGSEFVLPTGSLTAIREADGR